MLAGNAAAVVDRKVQATLELLKKMTLDHGSLSAADLRRVLDAGVSKAAIGEALEVAYLFNIYDRLADTMGWDVPAVESGYYKTAAKRLIDHGYQG